jgi:hypothetical protein
MHPSKRSLEDLMAEGRGLEDLVPTEPQDLPPADRGLVILGKVAFIAGTAGMAPAAVDPAFEFERDHVGRPSVVEPPSALREEFILRVGSREPVKEDA